MLNQKEMIESQRAEVLRLQKEYDSYKPAPSPQKKREPSVVEEENEEGVVEGAEGGSDDQPKKG